MEEGTFLPSSEMIPPIIQQQPLRHLGDAQHNDYVPVVWRTKAEQDNIQIFRKQDGYLHQPGNTHKQRPISDAGIDLHNRWKRKNESAK